jgi:5-methyltetrahydropteroyltriglutamate--homocysteine methyltransferase
MVITLMPFRADHIGSFLRPQELLQARLEHVDPARLRALEDDHIQRILKSQQELGLGIFTDGELRRKNFMSDFIESVSGFDDEEILKRPWNAAEAAATPVSAVTGIVTSTLKPIRSLTVHETGFLHQHSPGPIKVTLPSATQFPAISFKAGITDRVYPTYSALLWDIVAITKSEMERLSNDNIPYIQIDAPRYSYFLDPKWRNWIEAEMKQDPIVVFREYLKADSACLQAARKPGVTLGIHLCRGNNRSHWYAEGGYDAIAEELFNTLAVDRFLLEYDDERSGTFEPLRLVPKGKTVVLGLVSTKRPELESKESLLRRIDHAAKYVPLESLALSPQCGFASTMEGNLLTEDEQWSKLRLVVEAAQEVWGTP